MHSATLFFALAAPTNTLDLNSMHIRIERKEQEVDMEKVTKITDNMFRLSAFDYPTTSKYINIERMTRIFKGAQRASYELDIPEQFIIGHWFLESGSILDDPDLTFWCLRYNNLGGIMNREGKLKIYSNLEAFFKDYIALLSKNDVKSTHDFGEFINRLEKMNYFGETPKAIYASSVKGTLKKIQGNVPEYHACFTNITNGKSCTVSTKAIGGIEGRNYLRTKNSN
jgi:hypothetical protein